jgi:uncharacterized membrane protein
VSRECGAVNRTSVLGYVIPKALACTWNMYIYIRVFVCVCVVFIDTCMYVYQICLCVCVCVIRVCIYIILAKNKNIIFDVTFFHINIYCVGSSKNKIK